MAWLISDTKILPSPMRPVFAARSMASIADVGARLRGFALEHPEAEAIADLLRELGAEQAPVITQGPALRYRAQIETPGGIKELS